MDTPLHGDHDTYEPKAAVTRRRVLLATSRTVHAHRWRTDAVTDDTVDTTGGPARENGVVRAAGGASSETYRGTTGTGARCSRSLATAHGRVARRPAGPLPPRRRGRGGPEGLSPGIGCRRGMAGLSP
ncbi:hypothetical protein ACGF8B_14500 [Streptomyces sp. NPDC047917]|uniref:hypothetical protein n=1 Tax=Streptomyces sp. NPDC047917 TaxID=3365491 RepID=UPI00371EC4B9